MALPLDGPRLPPAAGGAARQLVVFLHGYGADGNDLIGLGREWARALPHAAFVSPHAPEPCGAAPMGRQWFNLTFRDPGELVRGISHASPALEAFLDAELKKHNLGPRALALVGFSQGAMLALGVGLKRSPSPAAIVGYSGALATVEALPQQGRHRRRPSCSCTAIWMRSFRSMPCISPASSLPKPASPSSGTWLKASATASTRKACISAARS